MSKIYRVRWVFFGKSYADAFTTAENAFNFAFQKQREQNVYDIVFETEEMDVWEIGFRTDPVRIVTLPAGTPIPDPRALRVIFATLGFGGIPTIRKL